ncbi:hypothetical protein Drorol1_Dr00003934 [Drosera rotundifolia]
MWLRVVAGEWNGRGSGEAGLLGRNVRDPPRNTSRNPSVLFRPLGASSPLTSVSVFAIVSVDHSHLSLVFVSFPPPLSNLVCELRANSIESKTAQARLWVSCSAYNSLEFARKLR